ncbi:MAG: tetratricopeptide repeat protein [Bacteroidetes bacterium]|nr:MAG: tetratricopeptide repeat protein [Bacteroidota bacterium]
MNSRLELVLSMLEKNPDDTFLNYAAALEFKKHGKIEKSIELLSNLVHNYPDYLPSYYQLGQLYEAIGKPSKAIEVYLKGKTVAEQQKDVKTLGEISEALMILGWEEEE